MKIRSNRGSSSGDGLGGLLLIIGIFFAVYHYTHFFKPPSLKGCMVGMTLQEFMEMQPPNATFKSSPLSHNAFLVSPSEQGSYTIAGSRSEVTWMFYKEDDSDKAPFLFQIMAIVEDNDDSGAKLYTELAAKFQPREGEPIMKDGQQIGKKFTWTFLFNRYSLVLQTFPNQNSMLILRRDGLADEVEKQTNGTDTDI